MRCCHTLGPMWGPKVGGEVLGMRIPPFSAPLLCLSVFPYQPLASHLLVPQGAWDLSPTG